jgi:dolichol-phosphate mannosyltransferase
VLPEKISGNTTAFLAVAALPLGLAVLNKLAARIAKKRRGPDARPLPAPSLFLLAQGLLHGACGYCLLALSLSLTVRAILPDAPTWTAETYTADMATVTLSYVAGFVIVVAPGGLGARELVMQWALAPQFAAAHGEQAAGLAVVVALTLRLTWTIAEVVVGLLLYAKKPALPPHVHHEKLMNDPSPTEPTPPTPLPEGKGEFAGSPFPSGRGVGGVGSEDLLSLVIPVYNERESLAALHAEIAEVAAKLRERVEMIFVDDGSKDDSWAVVREIAAKDDRVRGIKFRRNFGKAAALAAGFGAAKGGVVITMDADLQDDPHEIPHFLEKLRGGLDVVSGWKKVRHDPWHKVLPSRVFNKFLSVLTGVRLHDHNCGMKAYRAEALCEVHLYGEMHRFVPVLAFARGFKVGELVIQHRARKFGSSKYGWKRFIKGGLDVMTVRLLTGFGRRPQHFIGAWGLGFVTVALFGFFLLVVNALVRQIEADAGAGPFAQIVALILSVGFGLLGSQCLLTGLLAEMTVARKWLDNEPYSVAERTDFAERK